MSPFSQVAGAMQLISSQTLSAPAASFAFSNIPQNFEHLRLLVMARSSYTVAATDNFSVTLNGGGHTYGMIGVANTGSTVVSDGTLNNTSMSSTTTDLAGNTMNASVASMLRLDIPFYTNPNWQKTGEWFSGWVSGFDLTGHYVNHIFAVRDVFAAITSIQIVTLQAANFLAGSAAALYGIT